jgi:hypothetical protein
MEYKWRQCGCREMNRLGLGLTVRYSGVHLSAKPFTYRIPPIASHADANPARGEYGPSCPKPEIRV